MVGCQGAIDQDDISIELFLSHSPQIDKIKILNQSDDIYRQNK
jgi:hypothetical protein